MLCSFCEGTENSPLPHALLFDGPQPSSNGDAADTCGDCGLSLWTPCPNCIGLGKKLNVVGSCSRCGRSIPYWQTCKACEGSGRIYNDHHTCRPRKKSLEKALPKPHTVHRHHEHSIGAHGRAA